MAGGNLRMFAGAVSPLASGRWFGVAHLDIRIAPAFAAVSGASALVLPWLHAWEAMRPESA